MKPKILLETIRCEEGVPYHLEYHQRRLERSLHALGETSTINLSELIFPPSTGLYRCRFLYNGSDYEIEFHPYTPKVITSLQLVYDDAIDYPLKYAERDALNRLYEQRRGSDEIIIVKNGLLTDTTIANIALFIDGEWLTPEFPLLEGTTRARLMENKIIRPSSLRAEDIDSASKIALMNAMVGFVEIENGIIT